MENEEKIIPFRSGKKLSYIVRASLIAVFVLTLLSSAGLSVFGDWILPFFILLVLFTLISLIVWVNRSNRNIESFGVPRSYSTLFTTCALLVPGANMVLPYFILSEIWQVSTDGKSLLILRVWVLSMLAAALVGKVFKGDTMWTIIAGCLALASFVMFIVVITLITNAQELKHRKMTETA